MAVAVILITVAIVLAITLGKDTTPSQGGKEDNTVYNTNLIGDATVDPENVELEEEEALQVRTIAEALALLEKLQEEA